MTVDINAIVKAIIHTTLADKDALITETQIDPSSVKTLNQPVGGFQA